MAAEFPKWVSPHPSHIEHRKGSEGHRIWTPEFPDFHVDRGDNVTVMVEDAEHEAFALAERGKMEMPAPHADEVAAPAAGMVRHSSSEAYPFGWWGPANSLEPEEPRSLEDYRSGKA
jgi:hypothetical protein